MLLALAMVLSLAACGASEPAATEAPKAEGSVYWLNFKPESDEALQTLDFMYWVVTDPEASEMAVGTFGVMPYKQAKESPNPFYGVANEYLAKGCNIMACVNG